MTSRHEALGMVVHECNPSSLWEKAGASGVSLRSVWATLSSGKLEGACDLLSLKTVDVPYYQMDGTAPAESELCKAGFQVQLTQLQRGEDALQAWSLV